MKRLSKKELEAKVNQEIDDACADFGRKLAEKLKNMDDSEDGFGLLSKLATVAGFKMEIRVDFGNDNHP